ncbi:hypothetical protein OUZ56_016431, partial [Daphnia magna]
TCLVQQHFIVAPKRREPVVLTSLDRCPPVVNRSSKCRVPEVQVSENLESIGQLAKSPYPVQSVIRVVPSSGKGNDEMCDPNLT